MRQLPILFALAFAATCPPPSQPPPPEPTVNVHVLVRCDGTPARNVLVQLNTALNPDRFLQARTDDQGVARFTPSVHLRKSFVRVDGTERCEALDVQHVPIDGGDHVATVDLDLRAPEFVRRAGRVRFPDRAAVDDAGEFAALGASLFTAVWHYERDRAWLDEQARELATHGVDYVRAFVAVGPEHWTDRTIDPTRDGHDARLAGVTDYLYDTYGLRVMWTIFAGVEKTPTRASREALVDRVAAVVRGRERKVFGVEIANESWHTGFPGDEGVAEVRALGRRLQEQTSVAVALSAPPEEPGAACAMYGGWTGVATLHYDRDIGRGDGRYRPIRQPWGWPLEYECPGDEPPLPTRMWNNEPIGPGASVEEESDPERLALAYVTTFIARHGAYVFHSAPGIRGGGIEDLNRGRPARFADVPNVHAILSALQAAKRYTPPDLANWTRHNAQWASAPFAGFERGVDDGSIIRAYMSTSGDQVFGVILGIERPVRATAKRATTFEILQPATGEVLERYDVDAGESFLIEDTGDGVVLRGRMR